MNNSRAEAHAWSRRELLRASAATLLGATAASMLARPALAEAAAFAVKLAWIPNVEYCGYYLAQSKGAYTNAGIAPELIPGGPNSAVVPLVASGKALVGLEAVPENVVNAINAGSKLKIVAAQFQKSPECWVSLEAAPVKSPKEIEGKRLGITLAGKNTALVFMKMNGVDTSKVTLVPIQYDPAPLAAGEIDVLWGFASNQPVSLAMRGFPAYVMPLADFGFNRMQDVLFVSEETLADESKRGLVKAFLAASADGWKAALAGQEEAVAVIVELFGKSLGLKPDEQTKILAAMLPYLTRGEDKDKSQFWMGDALVGETVTNLGRIGVKADKAMFTNDLLA
jgi:ABC-type nitrate/sulfonate/bicarbonate transport system substrate-binding protein